MAADHKRRRITGTTVLGGTSWEQCRAKKKHLRTPQRDIKFNSCIQLEWDENQKQVVARKEQVGLSWRHLRLFVDSIPRGNGCLADVISLPTEIFELKNLTDVLSYEVWKTQLSEYDRNQLLQFLPKGQDSEQAVQALLDGNNLHFGNPLLKWGTSLCSGNLHPDAVVGQEQCLRSEKKEYFSNLQKYHNDTIEHLLSLKERWETSEDPEKEIVHRNQLWRPQNKSVKRVPQVNNFESQKLDGNVGISSESYSLGVEMKTCSSEHLISPVIKKGNSQKRIYEKGITGVRLNSSVIGSNDVLNGTRSTKRNKLLMHNIQCSDGAKYMSCVKVTRKQLELLKNTKSSGKSILSRSLNCILGDISTSRVQPYVFFVEEEQKKLHEHWLHLIKDDLPEAYVDWRRKKLQVKQVMDLLGEELKTKVNLSVEEEEKFGDCHFEHIGEGTDTLEVMDYSIARLEQKKALELCHWSDTSSPQFRHRDGDNGVDQSHYHNRFEEKVGQDEMEEGEEEEEVEEIEEEVEEDNKEQREVQDNGLEAEEVDSGCRSNQQGRQIPQLKDGLNLMETVSNQFCQKLDNASPELFYSGNLYTELSADKQGIPLLASEDAWQAISMRQSYPESNTSRGYTSGSNFHHGDSGKNFLEREPGTVSISSYPNQDRSDLLRISLKEPQTNSNQNQRKPEELHFQRQNNALIEQSHPTGHYQQQGQLSLPLEHHQGRWNGAYTQRSMSENTYPEEPGFLMSGQEQLPSVNLQRWAVNPSCILAALQSPLSGREFLNQHWFSSGQHAQSSWVGSGGSSVSSHSLGNGNMDQSLFSVLSHCSRGQPGTSYDPLQSAEQLLPSASYGIGSGVLSIGNVLPQTVQSFDYMTAREAATDPPLRVDERLWINLPQQNPPLNNSIGKPVLKPWNH